MSEYWRMHDELQEEISTLKDKNATIKQQLDKAVELLEASLVAYDIPNDCYVTDGHEDKVKAFIKQIKGE